MSNQTLFLTDATYRYLIDHSLREDALLRDLRDQTATMSMSQMQIAPEQGQFMTLLLRLINASRAIEIGVYTGYSSICIARGLSEDGELIACDLEEAWTQVARHYWARAGLDALIDLQLAPAQQTLQRLSDEGRRGQFDFVFIDADKTGYETYFELGLELLRPGGLIAVDNTLWDGSVADPQKTDADTEAIRAFNRKVHRDERVDISLVPIGDGLTLLRKRG